MRKKYIYSVTAVLILFNILTHTAFLHNIFTTIVICLEPDGKIRIENLEEYNECNVNLFDFTFNNNISNSYQDKCTDITFDINCSNDKQIIQKQKEIIRINILTGLLSIKLLQTNNLDIYRTYKKLHTNSISLSSFSTVLLQI